jgi:hypothetical protein
MKITAFLIVGTGEIDRYLHRVVLRLKELADNFVIGLNATDQETISYVSGIENSTILDLRDKEWGKEQWKMKELLFNKIRDTDWVICVDADEVLEVTRKQLEELTEREEIAYTFYCKHLWDNDSQMRNDGGWGGFRNVRFYKYLPELYQGFQKTSLHCGLAPIYAYKWCADAEYSFLHYGYMKESDRLKKVQRYNKYDPNKRMRNPGWYDSILTKPELIGVNIPLKYKSKKPKLEKLIKVNKMQKTYYIKNKYGQVYGVPEHLIEETLKRPGITLLGSYEGIKNREADVIDEPKKEVEMAYLKAEAEVVDEPKAETKAETKTELKCSVCGFEAKSEFGLKSHSRKHNV